MGRVLHGSATTTHAIRAAIQRSTASSAELSRTYGVNPKTVAKCSKLVFLISSLRLLRLTFRLTFPRLRDQIVHTALTCNNLYPIFFAMCHQRPDDTRHFIGQCYPD